MYTMISELPSQVTSSLDEKDCKKWMDVYNEMDPKTESEVKKAKKAAWKACKDLPSSFSFKIKASVDAIDKDREIIDLDSIMKHMDSYIDYGGNIQYEHGGYHVGCCWDWEPFTETDQFGKSMRGIYAWGNLFGGDQVYDQMREHFVKGRNSLSVAGEADKGKYQCDERGCYTRRGVKQLLEMSLCTVPANKHCKMAWYNDKASMTKSDNYLTLQVEEYEIHKSYKECPHLALRKSLRAVGYDAHAREDGVFVPMTKEDYTGHYYLMKSHGLCSEYVDGGMLVTDRESAIKKAFYDLYKSKAIFPDGRIDGGDPALFRRLLASGLVYRQDGEFYLARE